MQISELQQGVIKLKLYKVYDKNRDKSGGARRASPVYTKGSVVFCFDVAFSIIYSFIILHCLHR